MTFAFSTEVIDPSVWSGADLVVAADGVNSWVRSHYAAHFEPQIDWRPNRFVWLGTTFPFPAFTFIFKESGHGLWRVHAYRYEEHSSTFILETTEETWRRAGLDGASEDETVAFTEKLFARELGGHPVLKNRSLWRSFPTVHNARWHHDNVVLVGDAAHTAHFSIGSGTKLAMEDSIALARALGEHRDLQTALAAYEAERRPQVRDAAARGADQPRVVRADRALPRPARAGPVRLQPADAQPAAEPRESQGARRARSWPRWTAGSRTTRPGRAASASPATSPPPPMFTPFRLRECVLPNRVVVSPMCQYSAEDGTPGDWHLVHLGSRAVGGAGLVMTEMTDVSREARISPGCTGMYKPEHVAAWKRIVDFVHGSQPGPDRPAARARRPQGLDAPAVGGHRRAAGDGQLADRLRLCGAVLPAQPGAARDGPQPTWIAVRDDFVRAARMAVQAGFDLLELHVAHGYLLASFLSPLTNRRTDGYGGSLAQRLRFPLEVFEAVRAVWPAARPMSVRLSATDWKDGGLEPDEAVEVARALRARGCDVIDVSAGQTVPDQRPVYGRLFQTPFSDRIRHEADIPTMTVGAIASYADVNSILAAGRADLCVLARAHLYDPVLDPPRRPRARHRPAVARSVHASADFHPAPRLAG